MFVLITLHFVPCRDDFAARFFLLSPSSGPVGLEQLPERKRTRTRKERSAGADRPFGCGCRDGKSSGQVLHR